MVSKVKTKREVIDQWLCEYLARFNGNLDFNTLPEYRKDSYRDMAREIRQYIHSQDMP